MHCAGRPADESDKDGMRIVVELRRGEVAEIVLNNLYAQTPMETVFGSTWWRSRTGSRGSWACATCSMLPAPPP